jgi:hypothetical protein
VVVWLGKIILRSSLEIHTLWLLALVVLIKINSPHLNLVGHLILTQYQLFGLAAALLLVVLIQVTAAVMAAPQTLDHL